MGGMVRRLLATTVGVGRMTSVGCRGWISCALVVRRPKCETVARLDGRRHQNDGRGACTACAFYKFRLLVNVNSAPRTPGASISGNAKSMW